MKIVIITIGFTHRLYFDVPREEAEQRFRAVRRHPVEKKWDGEQTIEVNEIDTQDDEIFIWSNGRDELDAFIAGLGDDEQKTYSKIPPRTLQSLRDYVEHGLQPGGFLLSVLTNDLLGACGRADHLNRRALFEIASYVYNEMPAPCHGSAQALAHWMSQFRDRDRVLAQLRDEGFTL